MYWYSASTDSLCLADLHFCRKSRLECGHLYSTGTNKSNRAYQQLKVYSDLNDARPSSTSSSSRNSRLALALLIEGTGDALFNCRRQGGEDEGDDEDDDEADACIVLFILEETFHFLLSLSSLSTVTVPALRVRSRLAS